ncbi:peptide-methionine (S)-S-oxide reductase MsrA [Mesorhizobium australicum]|uniref:Peptide methionine sulfoxide reductase MsrA n=1 Tax=Mesorhizobium australicum TaxID=536018 RepID=A0A1X7NEA9_9HYPH|nr:peptide-methionine (S)-S-oxide reductase MsrA [Mesorhizobium australicum]SMH36029.1 peptide-methionine (S)-S-oxide reductase [Mesorhizobium australicum]
MFFLTDIMNKKIQMPKPGEALPGRERPIPTASRHHVFKRPLKDAAPEGFETIYFGMGCFWGAERLFWQTPGVWLTAVGYSGGETPNPTYQETCTGMTGHAEVVKVIFDPAQVSLSALLKLFWESHDPTQGMRQGNDVGTTYRSTIYTTTPQQLDAALASRDAYAAALSKAGREKITTEIRSAPEFYYAEEDHQQYLAKNPYGYCGLRGTGVECAVPAPAAA